MEQQTHGGTRTVRPAVLAIEVVCQDQGLDLFTIKITINQVGETSGQEHQHLGNFVTTDAAHTLACPEQFHETLDSPGMDIRRRLHEIRLQIRSQFFQSPVQVNKCIGVRGGNTLQHCVHAFLVRPPWNHPPARQGHLDYRIRGDHS